MNVHVGLIIGGDDFERGTWPWMVAMFTRRNRVERFFCGGTLVTSSIVVSGKNLNRSRLPKL